MSLGWKMKDREKEFRTRLRTTIIEIYKNITRGRQESRKGVNSLVKETNFSITLKIKELI